MAERETMSMEIAVPVSENGVYQTTQYGMRYPNGSYNWMMDAGTSFQHLYQGQASAAGIWERCLRERARQANVDYETYKGQHQLVERQVILSVTEAKDA